MGDVSNEGEGAESKGDTAESVNDDKQARVEKEKKELLESLAGGDYSAMRTKVAAVLNQYPHTRNSDVALSLKYWELFQPDIYNPGGILPEHLFKLERLHYIVRARAKIQNEYGLFQADEKIKRHRKVREEDMREAVLEDSAPRRTVSVFCDESGKNDSNIIIGSVWMLTGESIFSITRAIKGWQKDSAWASREVHFAKFGKNDLQPLTEYLEVIQDNRQFLSLKAIAFERARSRRSVEEIVLKLNEHLLVRGAEHEISTSRIDLPREMEVTLDAEQSLDVFALSDLKGAISGQYQKRYVGALTLGYVKTISSRISPLIQLADVVAGAMNRRLNHKGERNYKDEMADLIISELGLVLREDDVSGLDASALFMI